MVSPSSDRTSKQRLAHQQLNEEFDRVGPSSQWKLSNFDIGRPIGKGHFGRVYLARVRASADPFILVLKCLTKDEMIIKGVQTQVRREIEIMQQLRHPHIVRLYGWFHDENRIFLMMEFAGQGELYNHLARSGRFSEKRASGYIRQVADGLAYLHTKNVIHRDIKPENLLLSLNGDIKIADFGWSVYSPHEDGQRTLAGTLSYVSPEMVLGQPYGRAVDIWALGVLTYELVCGEEPFGADTTYGPRLVQSRICRCDVQFPDFVSDKGRSFISKLLQLRPADRLPLADVPHDTWITQFHPPP
ncbi:kinase-like domain-containing protein [Naematelia encephala]|uniref:Aurora kinase n=1 Tax=Naematelia encephala TaxID=71784 RepID=A0A1Y2BG13_9TREE|nr:kinase-like domain-containing protein [Naematelia encephala]